VIPRGWRWHTACFKDRVNVRALLVMLLLLGPAAAGAAVAGATEVDDLVAHVGRLEQQRAQTAAARDVLRQRYQQKAAAVGALKAEPSSWGRDRRLGAALADAKELATGLDAKDDELRALDAQILAGARALVAAADRELAADPPPDADRVAVLARARGQAAARLGAAPRLKLPDDRIDPADDAEDLDLKAAGLLRAEGQVRAEQDKLTRRASYYRRQAKLARARRRADEQDVFAEEAARRVASPTRPSQTADVAHGAAPPNPQTGPGPGTAGASPPGPGAADAELASDAATYLADVVQAATVEQLRHAERSADPESRARAAEQASADLAAQAARLHQRRLEMEQRARKLRGGAP
jgi:hypothetical protein